MSSSSTLAVNDALPASEAEVKNALDLVVVIDLGETSAGMFPLVMKATVTPYIY